MQTRHYRDLITRAVRERDGATLDKIIAQLADAARAKEILRAKGYGNTGLSASAAAAQVPDAH